MKFLLEMFLLLAQNLRLIEKNRGHFRGYLFNKGAHILLNLLNELGKRILGKRTRCEACQAFHLFFFFFLLQQVINSILIQEHQC